MYPKESLKFAQSGHAGYEFEPTTLFSWGRYTNHCAITLAHACIVHRNYFHSWDSPSARIVLGKHLFWFMSAQWQLDYHLEGIGYFTQGHYLFCLPMWGLELPY